MLVGTILLSFINEKTRLLQKRDIMYFTLPIKSRKIGFIHLLIPFIYWLSILLAFYIASFVIQPFTKIVLTKPSTLQLLTLNGLILFVIATYLLHRDLKAIFIKQSLKTIVFIVWLISYIAVFLPFYIVSNFGGAFGEDTPFQLLLLKLSVSPMWINVLGFLLCGISYYTFSSRKSHVHT